MHGLTLLIDVASCTEFKDIFKHSNSYNKIKLQGESYI